MIKILCILFLFSVNVFSRSLPKIEGLYSFNQLNTQIVLARKEILIRVVNAESEKIMKQLIDKGATCLFYAQQVYKCSENLKLQDLDNVVAELTDRFKQTSIEFLPTQFSPELTHEAPILTEYELIQSAIWKGINSDEENQFAKVKFMVSQDYFKIALTSKFSNEKRYFFMKTQDLELDYIRLLLNQEEIVKNQKIQSKYEVSRIHKYWIQTEYFLDH